MLPTVFVSYSSLDREHLNAFKRHAQSLESSGLGAVWEDHEVLPGAPWAAEIRAKLESARLVVALISPDFLASKWCISELTRAFALRDRRLLDVVPIVVRPCAWRETPLGAIQALPAGGAPIGSWPDPDAAWRDAVAAIAKLLRGERHAPAWPSRHELILRCTELLQADKRLMLLSPWRSGLEELAQAIARRSHGDHVTTLRIPTVEEMGPEEFYGEVSGDATVTTPLAFRNWLLRRSDPGISRTPHLVVLPYFGGPQQRVRELGTVMRAVFEQLGTFSLLVLGQARCAELAREVHISSLFSGIIVERIPGLDRDETQTLLQNLGADPVHAELVQTATGGHPEWTALAASEVRHGRFASLSQYLSDRKLFALLRDRLKRERVPNGPSHASTTLERLLSDQPVVRLTDAGADLSFPEVRLYYDGILVEHEERTQFRCDAARIAALRALAMWRQKS